MEDDDDDRCRSSGELFFDALDHFPPSGTTESSPECSSDYSSPSCLAEAPSTLRFHRRISPAAASGETEISTVTSDADKESLESGERLKLAANSDEDSKVNDESVELGGGEDGDGGGDGDGDGDGDGGGDGTSSLLLLLARVVLRVIVFQISFLIAVVTIPVWIFSIVASFIVSPHQTFMRAKHLVVGEASSVYASVARVAAPVAQRQSSDRRPHWIGSYALRFGLGLLWSVYVGFVLMGLFVTAFVAGGLVMKWVAEQPVQIKEVLNFDYTSAKPVAFVPVISCDGVSAGSGFRVMVDGGKLSGGRVLRPNQNVRVAVSLNMPESNYNRKLGVFQVSVEFVSVKGRVTSRSSHSCMLRFKSSLVHYVETFLKSGLLLTGYSSETQTRKLKFKGLKEGSEPTACVRVILEQRAEFRAGAGLPEIYEASLEYETELPFLKRLIWNWRKTMYLWTSLWIFFMELFFTLVCCHPFLLPWPRPTVSPINTAPVVSTVVEQ